MRTFLLTTICILGSLYSSGQSIDCKKVRTGKFKIGDEKNGFTIITRTGLIQREENAKYGIITEDTVKWISDCKYKIIMGRIIKNDSKIDMTVDMKFEVEILEIKEKSYIQKITSTVTGQSMTSEIEIEN